MGRFCQDAASRANESHGEERSSVPPAALLCQVRRQGKKRLPRGASLKDVTPGTLAQSTRVRQRLTSISFSMGFFVLELDTIRAGTPTAVVPGGTSWITRLAAPMRLPAPIWMFPSRHAPAPINTPFPTFGCRSPPPDPVPPRVTPCVCRSCGTGEVLSLKTRRPPLHHLCSPPAWGKRRRAARRPRRGAHVQHADVLLHDGRLPDHDRRPVVDEHPRPDPRRRVDVHGEHLAHLALERDGERPVAVRPEVVREAVRLDRLEALEVKQRLDVARARWVSVHDGLRRSGNSGVNSQQSNRRWRGSGGRALSGTWRSA